MQTSRSSADLSDSGADENGEFSAARASVSGGSAVVRAGHLLEALGKGRPSEGLSLSDLSVDTGLHKTTVLRLLAALEQIGFVERTSSGRYRVGDRLIAVGSAYLDDLDVVKQGSQTLDALVERTKETAHLAIPSHTDVVYVGKVESPHSLRMVAQVGARNPIYCTSLGRAMLAYADEEMLSAVIEAGMPARTPHTITDEKSLREELARTRVRGYAVDLEENREGICCIGAPVRDRRGTIVAAVSISGPTVRMPQAELPRLGVEVKRAADGLSRRLGYMPVGQSLRGD